MAKINLYHTNQHNKIISKIENNIPLSKGEMFCLINELPLSELGYLANTIKEKLHSTKVFFNHNIHLEITNECINNCKFCTFKKKINEGYCLNLDEILERLDKYKNTDITEVHITSGIHPKMSLQFYCEVIKKTKEILPNIHVKAFSAAELDYIFKKANITVEKGLNILKECGLDSIPGGGAEILDDNIRKKICPEKLSSSEWLNIHKTAHKIGIRSNATILYGHIENWKDRLNHLELIRNLQENTNGFLCFIPLKYRMKKNNLSYLGETSLIDDITMFSVSRIFLNNIPNIKVYWPMLGFEEARLILSFGANDIDGTIYNTTNIYKEATNFKETEMAIDEIIKIIRNAGYIPVERNSIYEIRKAF